MQEKQTHSISENSTYRLFKAVFALIQDRIELFSIEFSEEKGRLIFILLFIFIAVVLGSLALITLTIFIIALFWDSYRWQALLTLIIVYSISSLTVALYARYKFRHSPLFLQDTLKELEKDKSIFSSPSKETLN